MNTSKNTSAPAGAYGGLQTDAYEAPTMEHHTDEELGRMFGCGSAAQASQALGSLMRRHSKQLRKDAFRLSGGDAADADDLFGAFSLHLLEKSTMFDPELGAWLAWARKVLRGCASGERRKRKTRRKHVPSNSALVELAASDSSTPWMSVLKDEVARAFRGCLSELNEEHHRVFILRVYLGRTLADISRDLGLGGGVGPARSRAKKATEQIRKCMKLKGFRPNDC